MNTNEYNVLRAVSLHRNFKSPEKLQAHTRHEAEKPLRVQLEEGSRWFVNSAMTLSKLATISYDVPAKLQDGPQ